MDILSNRTTITLQSLPHEIHICILVFLDWQSIKTLRLTSQHFASLLPPNHLTIQHTLCSSLLHSQELNLLHRMEQEYWEAAEQAFLGLIHPAFSSSHHDPDTAAYLKRRSCSSDSLPCYICLRWLPSSTTDDAKFASTSCFTRVRCTLAFDLGRQSARTRNCIDCGLRRGMYAPGTIVKQSYICRGCGKLGEPIPKPLCFRALNAQNWWKASHCAACYGDPEICRSTAEQAWHERYYGKYDAGLRKGKAYRLAKGQLLQSESKQKNGFQTCSIDVRIQASREGESTESSNDKLTRAEIDNTTYIGSSSKGRPISVDGGPNAGHCPVMNDMRFCRCSRWKPPLQVRAQRKEGMESLLKTDCMSGIHTGSS